jgi:hypothetical protein
MGMLNTLQQDWPRYPVTLPRKHLKSMKTTKHLILLELIEVVPVVGLEPTRLFRDH